MASPTIFQQLYQWRALRVTGQCLLAFLVLVIMIYFGFSLPVTLTTISFIYLLLVIGMTLFCGFWQASLTSLLATACLDYFFTAPAFHFAVSDPKEWVALGVFQISAPVISRLSSRELRGVAEAAFHRTGMEQLYELSRNSLLLDLGQAPGPQLAVLIQRLFDVRAVALFDLNLDRQDRAGEWDESDEDIARECYLSEDAKDEPLTETWRRLLLASPGPVGALVVRG
jgi:two-component system, OmpR family, sensor histidine kinase KdpD